MQQPQRENLGPSAADIAAIEEHEEKLRIMDEQRRQDQMVMEYQKIKEGQSANPSQAAKNDAELDDFYVKWKQQEAEAQQEAAMRVARAQA